MPRELLGSCGKLQCSTRRLRQGNLTLRPVERDHPVGSRRCERREVRLTYPLAASQSEPLRTAGAPSRRRSMPGSTTVGIEAMGSMQWFLELLEELGIQCRVGHPAKIRAKETRKQKHDRRDDRSAPESTYWFRLRGNPRQRPDTLRQRQHRAYQGLICRLARLKAARTRREDFQELVH